MANIFSCSLALAGKGRAVGYYGPLRAAMGGIIKVEPLSKPERWEAGRSFLVRENGERLLAILLQEHKIGKENRIESSRKKQHQKPI